MQDVAQSARASITSVAESKVMQDAAAAASAAKSKTRASIVAITESETAKAAAATAGKAAADASSGLNSVGQKLSALISPVVDASDAALVRVGAAAGYPAAPPLALPGFHCPTCRSTPFPPNSPVQRCLT